MENKIIPVIVNKKNQLNEEDLKIFKLKNKIKLIEGGGFNLGLFIRCLICYFTLIIDISILLGTRIGLNNIFCILGLTLMQIILINSGQAMYDCRNICKYIRHRKPAYDLQDKEIFAFTGKVIEVLSEENLLRMSVEDETLSIIVDKDLGNLKQLKQDDSIYLIACKDEASYMVIAIMNIDLYKKKCKKEKLRGKVADTKAAKVLRAAPALFVILLIVLNIIEKVMFK